MFWKLVTAFSVGAIAAYAIVKFNSKDKREGNFGTPSNGSHRGIPGKVSSPDDEIPQSGRSWFHAQMVNFEREMLNYCVTKQMVESGFSMEDTLELRKQYSRVTLKPIVQGYETGFESHGLSAVQLNIVGRGWAAEHSLSSVGDWEKSIENYMLQKQSLKAQEIITDFLNKKGR